MARHNVIAPAGPVRSADTARADAVVAVTLTATLRSADTAPAFVLLDVTVPPYWDRCAPHWHANTTEVIYILNGTLAFTLDDTTTTASNGTTVLIPPGAVHTIWNPAAAPATYLAWFSSAGGEWSADCSSIQSVAGPAQPQALTLSATDDVLLAGADRGDRLRPD